MLLVLFLVRLAMGYQFQSVASTSAQLVDAFGLSYAEVGTLIGLFLLPGVFIAIPSGALTRTVADKNLLMFGAMAMVVGAFLMGSATNPFELYAGRVITGVGGTIFNVILTKMVTDWFIEKEIVIALSVMLTAWPIGIALGLLIHGPVAAAYGWSWTMYLAAIAALAALVLTAAFYRAPLSSATKTSTPLRYGLPTRELVHISIVGLGWTLYNAALVAVVSFAPDALVSAGDEPGAAHSVTSLFMWTMLISLPLGGRLLESIGYITTAITLSLLTAAALIIALSVAIAPVAMFVLLGVFAGIPAGALISLSAEAVCPENRGPGLGIFYTWYYAGMTVAPVIAGWLRDWSGSTQTPVLFSAVLMASPVLCVWILRMLQSNWPIRGLASGARGAS
jgi:MFS family permease